jgi:hypothetical protein
VFREAIIARDDHLCLGWFPAAEGKGLKNPFQAGHDL